MSAIRRFVNRRATVLVALGMLAPLFLLALPRLPGSAQASTLKQRFAFERVALPVAADTDLQRRVRAVHPALSGINGWISSVGAAVAIGDADGDGISNDLCHIDPRNDRVMAEPAPARPAAAGVPPAPPPTSPPTFPPTPPRYAPFELRAPALPDGRTDFAPMGCLFADVNEDGRADFVVYYWGRSPVAFIRAPGTGMPTSASYVAREMVEPVQHWYTNAGLVADFDGDGHDDFFFGNYFPDDSNILDLGSGEPVAMHDSKSRSFSGGGKHILLWHAPTARSDPLAINFTDVTPFVDNLAVAHGWTLAAGARDLDGDLLPDLYIANDFGPDRLLRNISTPGHLAFQLVDGERGFGTPKSFQLGHDSFKGMGVDFANLNGDGRAAILVSNIADDYALQESNFAWVQSGDAGPFAGGRAAFVQASERLGLSRGGWGWDIKSGDFANDGQVEVVQAAGFMKGRINRWPELQSLATSNDRLMSDARFWPRFRPGADLSSKRTLNFFARDGQSPYVDLAPSLGLDAGAINRGVAIGDLDGDGRLDFVTAAQWDTSYAYFNVNASPHSVQVHVLRRPGTAQNHVTDAGWLRPAGNFSIAHGVSLRVASNVASNPSPDVADRSQLTDAASTLARAYDYQVDGGNGHSGKSAPEIQFAIDPVREARGVPAALRWRAPGGEIHTESLWLKAGRHYLVLD